MAEHTLGNLKILGTTTTAGGAFRYVTVMGDGQINGDVACRKLSLTGVLKLAGNLQAEELKVTGQCGVDGAIGGLSLRGEGEIRTSELRMERIRFTGSLEALNNCGAEKLHISGVVEVAGLLSADLLELGMYGPCRAKEVGGGTITIKRSTAAKLRKLMLRKPDVFFTAELIEGDHIELQHTKADIVRGKRVIIGAECEINRVEFLETLEIHKSASVKQQIKL